MHPQIRAYVERGWCVIPIKPGTKLPAVKWREYQRRKPTEEELERWFPDDQEPSCAVITGDISGLVAVDVDVKGEVAASPEPIFNESPTGVIAKTPSGGWHLVYERPSTDHVPTRTSIRPGVDIRADGGYIVVAPTQFDDASYEWISFDSPGRAPKWAVNGQETFEYTGDGWLVRAMNGQVPEGERNNTMVRIVGYLARTLPAEVTTQIVVDWARRNSGKNPLSMEEIRACINGIYAKEAKAKRVSVDATLEQIGLDYMTDHQHDQVDWLIQDWLPEATICMVGGPPGAGKTWIMLDACCAVASGSRFLGEYQVHDQGHVQLLQLEDSRPALFGRITRIMAHHLGVSPRLRGAKLKEQPPIFLTDTREFNWHEQVYRDYLRRVIEENQAKLVMIDPFYYTTRPGDEHYKQAPADMAFIKDLRDEYGTSFLIAHHTKKATDDDFQRQDMLGSQTLNAFIETGWQCRPSGIAMAVKRHTKDAGDPGYARVVWSISDLHYAVQAEDCTYEEAISQTNDATPDSVDPRVLQYVADNPGMPQRSVIKNVTGATKTILQAISRLKGAGLLMAGEKGKGLHLAIPLDEALQRLKQPELELVIDD